MIDLNSVMSENTKDIESVVSWCSEIYDEKFAEYFLNARVLFERVQSKTHPITDDELSQILIDLPMKLFDVSEILNQFRLSYEVVKLRNKQKESDLMKSSSETTAPKRKSDAELQMIPDKLLVTAFDSVITRVENEISFCRELIMSSKKIWDARRKTEQVNPISEVSDLPDYNVKSYIKG
jgi:hypothetical protein